MSGTSGSSKDGTAAQTCALRWPVHSVSLSKTHATPPRRYTGSHTHRFDESGRGRGKAGREYVPGVDDNVAALADILRSGH